MSYRDKDVGSALEDLDRRVTAIEKGAVRSRLADAVAFLVRTAGAVVGVSAVAFGGFAAVSAISDCSAKAGREERVRESRRDRSLRSLCRSVGAEFVRSVPGVYSNTYSVICSRAGHPIVFSTENGKVVVTGD